MRYYGILVLPCAVLRYSYPPYAPPHLPTHICARSWNQEKVFFQFPESICIIYNVIRLTDKALLQFFTYTSTRMLILMQPLWQNLPVWEVDISPFACNLLDLVTVLPFFCYHECTLLITLEVGKINNQERMTWNNQIHFNKAVKNWWNILALWFIYILKAVNYTAV